MPQMSFENNPVLLRRPCVLPNVRVQVIMPPVARYVPRRAYRPLTLRVTFRDTACRSVPAGTVLSVTSSEARTA